MKSGHFGVTLCLCFKTSLSAQLSLIYMTDAPVGETHFHVNGFTRRFVLTVAKGISEMAYCIRALKEEEHRSNISEFVIHCTTYDVISLSQFSQYKNVNISKRKEDIPKRKTPFVFNLKNLLHKGHLNHEHTPRVMRNVSFFQV